MIPSLVRRLLARLRARPGQPPPRPSAPSPVRPPVPPMPLERGVNLVGFARGGLGLGENLRRFAEALHADRQPFALIDFDQGLGGRGVDPRLDAWIGTGNPHPTNVFFINADQTPAARAQYGDAFWADRRNIGFWFWELEQFPAVWQPAIDLVDAVWTASDFVRRSVATRTGKPVHRVAVPVELTLARTYTRTEFDLPEPPFLFYFNFDFHSYAQRKNPLGAIEAFRRAFPRGDTRAAMLIKSVNGAASPVQLEALRAAIGGDGRILVRDGYLDHATANGLMSVCDAYLSLHRSEGFGLGLAEAMYLGKPAVATGYSGNLDFMHADNSCLVRHRMIPVGPDEYPWGEGQHWADPDLDDAARRMRQLVDEPAFAQAVARAGAESIRRTHSPQACVASVRAALAPD